jgi:putative spermidine/putrescine transport system substrate-binding protein
MGRGGESGDGGRGAVGDRDQGRQLGEATMNERIARRQFLKGTAAAGVAAVFTSPMLSGRATAAEQVRAITWGGYYADACKKITSNAGLDVDWSLYQSASGEILAKIKAAWPNPPVDMSENWDPEFTAMHNEGWLVSATTADVPNLAELPKTLLVYSDAEGVFGIPISVGSSYWGYRKDLVSKPIREMSDLLDPSLKGKICITNATKGSGLTVVALAYGNGGSEKNMEPGWEFAKKLAQSGNIGRIATTELDIANSLNSGETAVSFWNPATWNEVKKNWPCEILAKADSKTLKSFPYQEGFVIFKGPRAKDAMKVANAALTPENQEVYNTMLGQAPTNPKAKVPPAAADFAMTDEEFKKYAVFLDYGLMAREHAGWVKRWEQEIQPLLRG